MSETDIDSEINVLQQKIIELEKKKNEKCTYLSAYYAAKVNKENVEYYIPNEAEYERMQDYSHDEYGGISYENFIVNNMKYIQKFSAVDKIWYSSLCKRFQDASIVTMDMEGCSTFTASYIFFDYQGRLCIGNER